MHFTLAGVSRRLLARDSCKILRRNIIVNETRSRANRFSTRGGVNVLHLTQYSHTEKCSLATKTRLYLQTVRNFVLNLFAATSQILLNLCARQCKFHFKILCRSSAASTFASQNISQMYPPRAVKTRLHKTPRAKQLCRAACYTMVFSVQHEHSRYKSVATYNRNTSILAFSTQQTFHSCTRARQASLWQLLLLAQSQDVSYRRSAI